MAAKSHTIPTMLSLGDNGRFDSILDAAAEVPATVIAARGLQPQSGMRARLDRVGPQPRYANDLQSLARHRSHSDGLLIIEDLFSVFRECTSVSPDRAEAAFDSLEAVLKESSKTVVFSTPYELQWLASHNAVARSYPGTPRTISEHLETRLSENARSIFFGVYDKTEVRDKLTEDYPNLTARQLDAALATLRYRFPFDSYPHLGTYQSWIPARHLGSHRPTAASLAVLEAPIEHGVWDFFEKVGHGLHLDHATVFAGATLAAGAGAALTPLAMPFVGLVAFRYILRRKHGKDENDAYAAPAAFLDLLANGLPAQLELLEARIGLPPRTLEHARELLTNDKLLTAIKTQEERLETVVQDLAEMQARVATISQRVERNELEIRARMWEIAGRVATLERAGSDVEEKQSAVPMHRAPPKAVQLLWLWKLVNLAKNGQNRAVVALRSHLEQEAFDDALRLYQQQYPEIVDSAARAKGAPILPFEWVGVQDLVVFPDGDGRIPATSETYDLGLAGQLSDHPLRVSGMTVESREDSLHLTHPEEVEPLPNLPLTSGFIHRRDHNGFPTDVRDHPAKSEHGAFFWIQPTGIRWCVVRMWVWDPREFGMSLWWPPSHASPLMHIRLVKVDDTTGRQGPTAEERELAFLRREYVKLKRMLDDSDPS